MNNIEQMRLIEEIVWQSTEVFFILSIILLFLFIILKKILDRNRTIILKKLQDYKSGIFNNTNTTLESIAYAQFIGKRYLYSNKTQEKKIILAEIKKSAIFTKLYNLYNQKSLYGKKLHIFSALVLLGDNRIKLEAYEIINNKRVRKKMPEFVILALLGLSTNIHNKRELYKLYKLLIELDKKDFITQKFSEFFFIYAFSTIDKLEIVKFFQKYDFISNNYVSYGFIYALAFVTNSKVLFEELLKISSKYKDDFRMQKAILEVADSWNLESRELSLKYLKLKDNYENSQKCVVEHIDFNNKKNLTAA